MTRYFVVLLALFSSCCAANYQVGDALVSDELGSPCFGLKADGAMHRIKSVSVFDNSKKPSEEVWHMEVVRPLEMPKCIRYGEAAAAPQLLPGRIYEAILPVKSTPEDQTRFYRAEFCIISNQGNDRPRVHQVTWDSSRNIWNYAPCGLVSDGLR